MRVVNGNYLVKLEQEEQKSSGIFVAMSNDTRFVKCKVIETPRDSSGLQLNELFGDSDQNYLYAFRDNLKEISLDGKTFHLLDKKDVVGFSAE